MAFAQLTYRESLRDIEVNLRAQTKRLYHMGLRYKTHEVNTLDLLHIEPTAYYLVDHGYLDFTIVSDSSGQRILPLNDLRRVQFKLLALFRQSLVFTQRG